MKSAETPTHSLDEVEDLTLFADEEFDTDEVDLFEFTGIDDSPLTRLKSIILSLDWEINDEILQELTDETASLQELWQGDKIAQVYLQGLDKLGRYLREEGAYAHPNAIKLLLTFYYDFEKIISSESITGDEITTLLKNDVRKFKILQYQIIQAQERTKVPVSREEVIEEVLTAPGDSTNEIEADIYVTPLQGLKAAILGLDWEVTDENLERFEIQVQKCLDEYQDNKPAAILLQGLHALGRYIGEKRAGARPEAFSLLDNFHEGLTRLAEHPDLDEEEQERILIDRVGRLNTLKAMVAGVPIPTAKTSEAVKQGDLDQTTSEPIDAEKPLPTADPASETARYPDEELDADAIQPLEDKLTDEFIEEELKISFEVTSALDGTDVPRHEASSLSEDSDFSESIEEQFDLFLSDEEPHGEEQSVGMKEEPDMEPALTAAPLSAESEAATGDDELEIQSDIEKKLDLLFGEDSDDLALEDDEQETSADMGDLFDDELVEEELAPALADVVEEKPDGDEVIASDEETIAVEIEEKLDFFFTEKEDEEVSAPAAAEKLIAGKKILDKTERSSDTQETQHEPEPLGAVVENKSSEPEPALAGTEEVDIFDLEDRDEPLDTELEENLDLFFAEEEPPSLAEETETANGALAAPAEEPESVEPALAATEPEGEDMPALAPDHDDTTTAEELEERLDDFFGSSEPLVQDEEEASLVQVPETHLKDSDDAGMERLANWLANLPESLDESRRGDYLDLIGRMQEEQAGSNNVVLLQLLSSLLTMLPEDGRLVPGQTADTCLFLLQGAREQHDTPDFLLTAVNRFTDWQKSLVRLMTSTSLSKAGESVTGYPEVLQDVVGELREELTQLRQLMKEEIDSLRRELSEK
ncbi:hypothetical protein [Desulfolithobacter sp.]